jgi:hypothetical protein
MTNETNYESKQINIKYSAILPLWSAAESFRKVGENLLEGASLTKGDFSAEEALGSAIANKILAMELYLKFIYALDYWCINCDRKKTKSAIYDTDNLSELYEVILPKRKEYISSLLLSDHRSSDAIDLFLASYEQEYYRWRYSYSRKSNANAKNKTISRILTVLRKCCVHAITEYKYIVPQNILRAINSVK